MRRLFGPVGRSVTFLLVAALVFAGLGWVTIAALRVEEAQREAAAQAELGYNLRVAVRQLDMCVLSTLTVEDSRPFHHYNSADPLTGSTAGPTPLLGASLPEWMKLHVQLDPVAGWDSPQVLSPDAAERVSNAWPELPLRNNELGRAEVLKALRSKYPARPTWDLLATRDRATSADNRPFAAPLFDPWLFSAEPLAQVPPGSSPKPPPPPEMGPISNAEGGRGDSFRLFGWELRADSVARGTHPDNAKSDPKTQIAQSKPPKPPAFPPQEPPPGGAVGRDGYPITQKELQQWREFRNRAQTIQRATEEAKNAGQDFNYGRGQLQQNLVTPNTPGDGKGAGNNALPGLPLGEKDARGKDKPGAATDPPLDKLKKAELGKGPVEEAQKLQAEQLRGTFSEHLCALSLGLERQRCLEELREAIENSRQAGGAKQSKSVLGGAVAAAGATPPARLVPPAEDRPLPNLVPGNVLVNNTAILGERPVNVHLGSMRPQWITAADGTETLVLVRAAIIDGKTVYQGVVLDWPKLEQLLKEEVKELFPDAKLVPVKDPAQVAPDRAMTALPVQLDPGVSTEPPPAGWTLLRVGLVLAWVAALVAFAAVGFSGWSLLDLAERRIRFVSAVTHELRTPLTSLRLYLDLLMSGMIHDEAKRQEYLNTLATESDRLHRLIDNVLDFAKLEKRAKNGDVRPVKVVELIEQLRATWADRVAADGKELVVVSTLAETEVVTDPAMVLQIVGNLIDNARKYTRDAEDRRIWLWVKPGAGGRVVFEVEDRGCGVPPGERKSIFKPFRRGSQADAKAGGAGLGLALAKQWAEVLGGTVAYRPATDAPGACFRLELPTK